MLLWLSLPFLLMPGRHCIYCSPIKKSGAVSQEETPSIASPYGGVWQKNEQHQSFHEQENTAADRK